MDTFQKFNEYLEDEAETREKIKEIVKWVSKRTFVDVLLLHVKFWHGTNSKQILHTLDIK